LDSVQYALGLLGLFFDHYKVRIFGEPIAVFPYCLCDIQQPDHTLQDSYRRTGGNGVGLLRSKEGLETAQLLKLF